MPPNVAAFIAQHGVDPKAAKAKKKPKPKPWNPLGSPLPSLAAIRIQARTKAQEDINSLLAATPKAQTYKDQSALSQEGIQGINTAAQGMLGNLQSFGVEQGNAVNAGAVTAGAGAAQAAGVAPVDSATANVDLMGRGVANFANYLTGVRGANVARGQMEGLAEQAELDKELKDLADTRAAIRAKKPELYNTYLDKLKEFYLGIQGAQQQAAIAQQELGIAQDELDIKQDKLDLDTRKVDIDERYKNALIEVAVNKAANAEARLALSQSTADFNQWLQRQKLGITKAGLGIRRRQLQLAIDKAEKAGKTVSPAALNQVYNLIDKQIMAVNTTPGGKKTTSHDYVFYAFDPGFDDGDTTGNPVKSFTARGANFEEAWTKAKTIVSQKNWQMPSSRSGNVIPPEFSEEARDAGWVNGPAFREERINPKTATSEGTVTSKYGRSQVYNMAVTRLSNLGVPRATAKQLASDYIRQMYGHARRHGIGPRSK